MLKNVAPAMTVEEVNEAQKKAAESSGPRELAPKGTYKVRLHSMRGRSYEKDGQTRDLASIFFINMEGRYKGAELTLFRKGGDPATTTNLRSVVAILTAAGLTPEEIATTNWAIDTENPVDEKGNVVAAFVKADDSVVSTEGLEFDAYIDVEEQDNGYEKNVIKSLRPATAKAA